MGEAVSDMWGLMWGGKLGEVVLGLTVGLAHASAMERPAPTTCASARRMGASVASSRSRRVAVEGPVIAVGGASVIRRRKAVKRPKKECMGASGVARPAPHAASA